MLPFVQKLPYRDPSEVLACFAEEAWICFFDSAKPSQALGRFSFIAFNPFIRIVASPDHVLINDQPIAGDPWSVLQQQLKRYSFEAIPDLPPFQGGAMGYFAYDLLHHLEKIPRHPLNPMDLPEMMMGLYDTVIAFDVIQKKMWVIAHGLNALNSIPCAVLAEKNAEIIVKRLNQRMTSISDVSAESASSGLRRHFNQQTYCHMVQQVIDYIEAGDIFQANVSQCFTTTISKTMSMFDLYRTLRRLNPAPFSAYLNYGAFCLLSASPERFLKLHDALVETRPIKGTRPRSEDVVEDQRLAQELLNSAKDHAENVMITDLMRNDLSRVCEPHSVKVKQLCALESYQTVHHLVSSIEGRLSAAWDAIDLLRATFPGGSITGAPKVRAMEIIATLEPTERGPYCGSIGYISFSGDMDTSIVIRTLVVKGETVTFNAGGGIVADSCPEEEYEETWVKIASLLRVLGIQR